MPVSIKDIARAANVSYSTVSRALSDSPRVNKRTKARIQKIAAEMGYLPSAVARSLVTRRTRTIGVVVTTITDPFFAEVIHGLEKAALQHHYSVILANSGGQPHRELQAIRQFRERWVDGIILVSACSPWDERPCDSLTGLPMVIISRSHQEHPGFAVEADNMAGGRMATQHLADLGHRRIAHIAGPATEWDAVERKQGYEQVLQAAGIPLEPAYVLRGGLHAWEGVEAMNQLLALPSPPTAVFCYNDAAALGAMRAAHRAGMRIPKDLSVVGFDDIHLAPYFEPPLTTIAQPKQAMAEVAVQMVLALLDGDEAVADQVLPGELIVRESTARPGG